ncbi:MAG: hypothetical protein J6R18_10595 [Kiritimatiellae bacterium]|nr:hypothetical protein [Kiritimatiellia bacterium]
MKRSVLIIALAFSLCAPAHTVFRRPFGRVASMDPLRAADVLAAAAVALVYEPLLEVDYKARPYKLKECVCELPVVSEDKLAYVFRIAEGRVFRNGSPVTSSDIKRCLDRLADKSNASPGMWTMDGVKSVEIVDEKTVRITLKKPSHVFTWLMAMPYTGIVAEDGSGSGAYWLKSWRKNHEMVFVKNDNYREKVEIDEIRFPVVEDVSTQWLMFLGGELDFLGAISRDNWDAVVGKDGELLPELRAKGMNLMSSSSLSVFYIGFNMKDPVVGSNKKLRQALNCAFDFPAWKRFLNNRILPSDGPLPPGIAGKIDTPFAYAYNEDNARKLLAEAGYRDGKDPKTGRRLHLEIAVGRATQDAREMMELLASFYNRVGIDLEARYMTWDAFLTAVNEGRTQMHNLGWIGDYPDPENFLQLFHSKNVSPGANHSYYVNPEFDKAYDAMDWGKAQEIIREDCPWIFLYSPKTYSLMWNRVENYIPTDFAYGIEKHLRLKAK